MTQNIVSQRGLLIKLQSANLRHKLSYRVAQFRVHTDLRFKHMVRLREARRPREGITLSQFLDQFAPNEAAAEAWLVARRWPTGIRCAHCVSAHIAESVNRRRPAVLVLRLPALLFLESTFGDASVALALPGLGRRGVFDAYQSNRRCEHKAGSRSRDHPEIRLAPVSSHPCRIY